MASGQHSDVNGKRVLERELAVWTFDKAVLLDAVETVFNGQRVARLVFASGSEIDGLQVTPEPHKTIIHNFGGAPVVDLVFAKSRDRVTLELQDQNTEVVLSKNETDLFENLNVLVAVRNGETLKTTLDWLSYHVTQHGMQAAVIIDRAKPKHSAKFAAKLKQKVKKLDGLERLVVIHADTPLGKADLPDEAHPFNVHGAPGKDRMEIPPADAWTSPLGEMIIYEIMRARFLSDARAVANVDLFDLITVPKGGSVFDLAANAPAGYVALEGRQAYPWRVRNGDKASFGDHICVQFDSNAIRRRWCVAPKKIGEKAIWRLIRVVGADPEPDVAVPFYRYMALRHPTESVSKIVPKTSLVEAPDLLALSQNYFGAKPVRIPEEKLEKSKNKTLKTTIVTTMKNEGPFILEWLAYHRVIGVDDFLVYTNDCTDGTDTMLDMLQEKGIVQHRDNPFRNTDLKPQHAALQAADDEPIIRNADWLVCMDVDEFINVKCGDGHLKDLFKAVGNANMISMTWRLFGNNNVRDFKDELMIEAFDRCAFEVTRKPHQAWGFKTLFRNAGIFKKLGVHRPKGLKPQLWEDIAWVNGSGKDMPPSMYRNGWRCSMSTYGYDLVQLNHYAVRSAESFLVKRDRGRVNHVDRDQGLSYWFRMNNNAEEETSIMRMIPAVRAEMDRLLSDPDIAAAHAHSVKMHRDKIEELKTRDDFLELFEVLTSRKMKRLSRMHAHFGANVFLSGPGVIPDEVADHEPGDDFWFTVEKGETTH